MSARAALTLFAHLVARPDAEVDLAEAALTIAEAERPGLDLARYRSTLDDLAKTAAEGLAVNASPEARLTAVLRHLYETVGFKGNDSAYYDPRNSFLDEVIDRRTGIPISLAVVLTEVCRRAGVAVTGVSFPRHFLVRCDTPRGTIIVDPFTGRPLSREELTALYARATGREGDPPAKMLEPATKAEILTRMLHNLRAIYEQERDQERLARVDEWLRVLAAGGSRRSGGAPS